MKAYRGGCGQWDPTEGCISRFLKHVGMEIHLENISRNLLMFLLFAVKRTSVEILINLGVQVLI